MVLAISLFVRDFIANARMPAAFALPAYKDRIVRSMKQRLHELGYADTIEPMAAAAELQDGCRQFLRARGPFFYIQAPLQYPGRLWEF